jgi:hypothetical protein
MTIEVSLLKKATLALPRLELCCRICRWGQIHVLPYEVHLEEKDELGGRFIGALAEDSIATFGTSV